MEDNIAKMTEHYVLFVDEVVNIDKNNIHHCLWY